MRRLRVLGLVSNTHDSGVALVRDGLIECVLEEERFNRDKRTKAFPALALAEAMRFAAIAPGDISAIVTPWNLHKLRAFVARTIVSGLPGSVNLMHAAAHPAQRNQILALNRYLKKGLSKQLPGPLPPLINVGHHDAHAAAFFVSPFEEALVVVMDGYGDDCASSAYMGRGGRLERVWSTDPLNSLGLVYTAVTAHLGFEGFGDEGKVMALAAYGSNRYVDAFRQCIQLDPDGGYTVDMSYFDYGRYGLLRPFKRKFIDTFGARRAPDAPLNTRDEDLARALQVVTEETILHVVRGLLRRYPTRNVVLTGGVALNCVANGRVLAECDIDRLWVPPCASDTGAPLGAALWHTHQTLGHPRTTQLTHPYFGSSYTDAEIDTALAHTGLTADVFDETTLVERVAAAIASGKIVGWFQGRFEMGPRALGNRSILADPRRADMKDILNARIKKREPFRPFAPAVPWEAARDYFDIRQPDPFMTLAPVVRADKRSVIPAAVHIDGTGRIQTVEQSANPRYHALLTAFGRLTGVPVLINTSFNESEPIVNRPEEAIACFQRTAMDVLVLGTRYVERQA
jgi:carbamoyltransferase